MKTVDELMQENLELSLDSKVPEKQDPQRPSVRSKKVFPKEQATLSTPPDLEMEAFEKEFGIGAYAPPVKEDTSMLDSFIQWGAEALDGTGKGLANATNIFKDLITASPSTRKYAYDDTNQTSGMIAENVAVASPFAVAGGAVGSLIAPGIGTIAGGALGAAVGEMVYGYFQDPNDEGFVEILDKGIKARAASFNALNRYAIQPNDPEGVRRVKNAVKGAWGGAAFDAAGLAAGATAKYVASKLPANSFGKPIKEFVDKWAPSTELVIRDAEGISALMPNDAIQLERSTAIRNEANNIKDWSKIDQETVQAEMTKLKEEVQEYSKKIVGNEPEVNVEKVAEVKAQMKKAIETGEPVEGVELPKTYPEQLAVFLPEKPMEQMSFMDYVAADKDLQEAKFKQLAFKELINRKKADTQGLKQLAGQKKFSFMEDPAQPSAPTYEQLSLFNMDDIDEAGFGLDPKQGSLFDQEFDRVFPKQSGLPENEYVEAVRTAQTTMRDDDVIAADLEKDAARILVDDPKITAGDADLVDTLIDIGQMQKEALTRVPKGRGFIELQEEAKTKFANMSDKELYQAMLDIRQGRKVMDAESTIQFVAAYERASVDLANKVDLVASGAANDLQVVDALSSDINFMAMTDALAMEGSLQGRALGARRMIYEMARQGNPNAIEAVGAMGKARMIRETIRAFGGRDVIENEFKAIQQVRLMATGQLPEDTALEVGGQRLSQGAVNKIVIAAREALAKADADFALEKATLSPVEISSLAKSERSLYSYITQNMLLHWGTFARVSLYGVGEIAYKTNRRLFQATGLFGDGDIARAELEMATRDLMGNLINGMYSSWKAVKEGRRTTANFVVVKHGANKGAILELAQEAAKEGTTVNPNNFLVMWNSGWTGKGQALLSTGVRALGAAEGFFGHLAEQSSLRTSYYREAAEKGMSRKDAIQYVQRKMDIGNHPKDYMTKAQYAATRLALNSPPETVLGQVAEETLGQPYVRLMFPFTRAAVNDVETAVQLFLPTFGESMKNLPAGEKRARVATSMGILGTLTYLHSNGTIQADLGIDPRVYQEDGEKAPYMPNSIQLLDKRYPLDMLGFVGPMAAINKLAGTLSVAFSVLNEQEYAQAVSMSAAAMVKYMTPNQMFDTMGLFMAGMDGILDPDANGAARPLGQIAGGFAERMVPGFRIQKDINNMAFAEFTQDTAGFYQGVDYVTNNIMAKVKNAIVSIPGGLPVKPNLLMEPVGNFGNTTFKAVDTKSSDVMDQLFKLVEVSKKYKFAAGDLSNGIKLPSKIQRIAIEGAEQEIELSPAQYMTFVSLMDGLSPYGDRLIDSTFRERVENVMQAHSGVIEEIEAGEFVPDRLANYVTDINEVYRDAADFARQRLIEFHPEIVEDIVVKQVNEEKLQQSIMRKVFERK